MSCSSARDRRPRGREAGCAVGTRAPARRARAGPVRAAGRRAAAGARHANAWIVRGELQDLLAELALPTLIVTHDFRDAAAIADYIGVVVDGTLRQLGPAEQLVEHPAEGFVVSLASCAALPGRTRAAAARSCSTTGA
jgi:hypothetical protein